MGMWDALFAGLGGALQQAGAGVAADRVKQEDRAIKQQALDLEREKMYEDPTSYAPLFKALGLPDPSTSVGPQRVRAGTMAALMPILSATMKEKRELADREGVAAVTREAAGTPPTPAPVAPDVPVADGMEALFNILKPGKAPLPMNDVRARLATYGKEGRETFKEMYPSEKFTANDRGVLNTLTGDFAPHAAPGTTVQPPPNSRPKLNVNEKGEQSTSYENEPWQHGVARKALADLGWKEGTPGYDTEFYNAVSQLTPVSEGGGAAARSQGLRPPPSGSGGAPGAGGPTPVRIQGPQKPPEAKEREDIVQLNSLIPLGEKLIAQWAKDPDAKPNAIRQAGEREIFLGIKPSDVIGPTTSSTQKTFMAESGTIVGAFRKIQSGLNVTNSEAGRSMPTLPDDPSALTREQLTALVEWAKKNRTEIDRALIAAGRAPGPAPQTAPPAPGGRVRVIAPDGTPGTLPAGAPIPPGYRKQ